MLKIFQLINPMIFEPMVTHAHHGALQSFDAVVILSSIAYTTHRVNRELKCGKQAKKTLCEQISTHVTHHMFPFPPISTSLKSTKCNSKMSSPSGQTDIIEIQCWIIGDPVDYVTVLDIGGSRAASMVAVLATQVCSVNQSKLLCSPSKLDLWAVSVLSYVTVHKFM